jgi:uncharacterized protein DUF5666
MKNIRFLVFILTIGTLLLSACGAAAATPNAGGGKVEAMPVAFLGTVNSIAGNQWVISGTTVTVDPSVVRDGPFNVGDQVKVEGVVNPDGSFTVSRVEVPAPQDVSALPQFNDDNAEVNDDHGNDADINDDHGHDANLNDDHGNDVELNDDHGHDASIDDDNSSVASPNNNNTVDDHSGSNSGKDSGGGKGSGGDGNDKGGSSNDG